MERSFYHSFPRRGGIERGLQILSSIIESGLLLTPELISFREGLDDGTESDEAILQQKRICFTELSPDEVAGHGAAFGSFALEWDIKTLRGMGVCPVFYVPIVSSSQNLGGLGAAMLMRLGEAQAVLERLQELSQGIGGLDPHAPLNVTLDGAVVSHTRATAGGATDLLSFVQQGVQPIPAILNALRGTLGLFYPTENLEYTGLMAYYRQREWRILANVVHLGQQVNGDPTEAERTKLLEIDPDFFSGELAFRSGADSRVNHSQYIREHLGAHVFATVRRVIVPAAALEEATHLVREAGWETEVVPLSSA